MELTQEFLKKYFEYRDGNLYKLGSSEPCGYLESNGYLRYSWLGKNFLVHRLIFLIEKGYLPDRVDHKDLNTLNNYIDNLRDASHSDNMCNSRVYSNNQLGIKNIRRTANGRYQVRIHKNKKTTSKIFVNLEDAIIWRDEMLLILHGDFANRGEK